MATSRKQIEQIVTPPNLRQAAGQGRSCGNCRHFDSGRCTLYGGFPVAASEVCDSFERRG